MAFAVTPLTRKPSTCSGRSIADCGDLSNTPMDASGSRILRGLPRANDGTIVFNPLAPLQKFSDEGLSIEVSGLPEVLALNEPTPAQVRNALAIADEVRKSAVELFAPGAIALTPQQKIERDILVSRLGSLKMAKAADDDTRCAKEIPLGFPGAFYDHIIHTLLICPAVAKTNAAAIARTIAHELGHVISPCYTMRPAYSVDPKKANSESLKSCLLPSDFVSEEGDGSDTPKLHPLRRLVSGDVTLMIVPPGEETTTAMIGCGILSPIGNSNAQSRSILGETQSCIERLNRTRYTMELERDTQTIESMEQKSHSSAVAKAKLISPEQCHSRTMEHFADSFGARLTGRYAKKKRWSSAMTRSAFLEFVGYSCHGMNGHQDDFSYPPFTTRLQVFTNDREIASRLKCETSPRDPLLCPLEISFGATPSRNRSTTSAAGRGPASEPGDSVELCWGQRKSRCYHLADRKLTQTYQGSVVTERKLEEKRALEVRKRIDDYASWATKSKARVEIAKSPMCGDLVSIERKSGREIFCLDLAPAKEVGPKHQALAKALGSAKP